jgi:hypothetical protein
MNFKGENANDICCTITGLDEVTGYNNSVGFGARLTLAD